MNRLLLLVCASFLLAAPTYAGINLSWDDCGSSGEQRKEFACDTNVGAPFKLVGSIVPYQSLPEVVGAGATINVMGTAQQLPDWWKLGSGACRGTASLSLSFDFQDTGPYTCADPWLTRMQGMFSYQIMSPTSARIHLAGAMPQGESAAFDAGWAELKAAVRKMALALFA